MVVSNPVQRPGLLGADIAEAFRQARLGPANFILLAHGVDRHSAQFLGIEAVLADAGGGHKPRSANW